MCPTPPHRTNASSAAATKRGVNTSLTINRASWVVEVALEWREQKESELPQELLAQLSNNLFADSRTMNESHNGENLLATILGAGSQLKATASGGAELQTGRRGLRTISKKVKGESSRYPAQRKKERGRQAPPSLFLGVLVALLAEPHHDLIALAGVELELEAEALAVLVLPRSADLGPLALAVLVLCDDVDVVGGAVIVIRPPEKKAA
jgi:hypothetical protein